MKRFIAVLLVVLCSAPLFAGGEGKVRMFKDGVKDQYIVRLADTLSPDEVRSLAFGLALQHGGKLGHVFASVVPGFEVTMPEGRAEAMARHPLVEYVEQVAVSQIAQVQTNAPWHLDRLDDRTLDNDGTYYMYCNSTTVNAYVIDTGMKATHTEFWYNSVNPTSRVIAGKNVRYGETDAEALNPCSGWTNTDDYMNPCSYRSTPPDRYCTAGGHGTAVGSVLGGVKYGVAKHVSFIAVRTHNCSGSSDSATIARGLEWVYNDKPLRTGPAVLNMSFGIDVRPLTTEQLNAVTYFEEWVNKVITDRNIFVAAAATNSATYAHYFSPARLAHGNAGYLPQAGKVVTVGGSNNIDWRWKCNSANAWEYCHSANLGSNYGRAIDIFAPSQNILSGNIKEPAYKNGTLTCCYDSDSATRQEHRSGTSFAAPMVAGVAAIHLIGSGSARTPEEVWQIIRTEATGDSPSTPPAVMGTQPMDANSYSLGSGSPNRLLYRQGVSRCRLVSF